jgi:hypothetical protein
MIQLENDDSRTDPPPRGGFGRTRGNKQSEIFLESERQYLVALVRRDCPEPGTSDFTETNASLTLKIPSTPKNANHRRVPGERYAGRAVQLPITG